MKKLGKEVSSSVADNIARIELAKVNVPALQLLCTPKDPCIKSTIFGVIEFPDQRVLLTRGDNYWALRFAVFDEKLGEALQAPWQNEEYKRAFEQERKNQLHYHIIWAPGHKSVLLQADGRLEEFVGKLRAVYGRGKTPDVEMLNADEDCCRELGKDFVAVTMRDLSVAELVELEVTTLRAYGARAERTITAQCGLEAIQVIEDCLDSPERSRKLRGGERDKLLELARSVRTSLAAFCRMQSDLCSTTLEGMSFEDSDRLKVLAELEWWLTNRLVVLPELGFTKEMSAVRRKTESLRMELWMALTQRYRETLKEIDRLVADGFPRLVYMQHAKGAVLHYRMSELCYRLGVKQAARVHARKAVELEKDIGDEQRRNVRLILAKAFGIDLNLLAEASSASSAWWISLHLLVVSVG